MRAGDWKYRKKENMEIDKRFDALDDRMPSRGKFRNNIC